MTLVPGYLKVMFSLKVCPLVFGTGSGGISHEESVAFPGIQGMSLSVVTGLSWTWTLPPQQGHTTSAVGRVLFTSMISSKREAILVGILKLVLYVFCINLAILEVESTWIIPFVVLSLLLRMEHPVLFFNTFFQFLNSVLDFVSPNFP